MSKGAGGAGGGGDAGGGTIRSSPFTLWQKARGPVEVLLTVFATIGLALVTGEMILSYLIYLGEGNSWFGELTFPIAAFSGLWIAKVLREAKTRQEHVHHG